MRRLRRNPWLATLTRHRRLVAAGGAVLALLGLALVMVLLPTANVTVLVAGSRLQADVQLAGATNLDYANSPHDFVTQTFEVTDSVSQQVQATGHQSIAAIPAAGEIVFSCSSSACVVRVPANTIVLTTDQHRYATRSAVQVTPAAPATARVSAVVAGVAGNADPDAIRLLAPESGLAGQLTVTNPAAITGGAEARTATLVQQSDVDTARQALATQLSAKLHDTLKAQGQGLHLIIAPQPDYESEVDHAVGDEVPTFSLTLNATLHGVGWRDEVVHQLLRDRLTAKLPKGYQLTGDPINTTYRVTVTNQDGTVTLEGRAFGFMMPSFSLADLRREIAGRFVGSARDRLLQLPKVVDVLVRQDPLPTPWLPFQTSHIALEVRETAGAGST